MKKIIQKLIFDVSLSKKFFALYVISSVVPTIIFMILGYVSFLELTQQHFLKSVAQSMDQTAFIIQSRLDNMVTTAEIVMLDNTLQRQLNNFTNPSYDLSVQTKDYNEVKRFFKSLERNESIYKIRLYIPGQFVYAFENDNYNNFDDVKSIPMPESARNIYNLNDNYYYNQKNTRTISVSKFLRNPKNYSENIALLKIDTKYDAVLDIIKLQARVAENCIIYLNNGENMVISDEAISELPFMKKTNTPKGEWQQEVFNGKNGYRFEIPMKNTDWHLGCFVPWDTVFRTGSIKIVKILLIWILFISLLAYILIWYISAQNTKRVDAITQHMKKIQDGDLSAIIEDMGKDDIGILVKNFNTMVCQLSDSLQKKEISNKKMAQAEYKAVRAELRALQSQINPHFLYNTLNFINWEAIRNNLPDLEKLVDALSQFYRQSLGKDGDIVTIESELKHIENYITIQNMRFHDSIKLITDLENVKSFKIPRITLQPIIENTVTHGFSDIQEYIGTIKVYARLQDGEIELVIEDDGKGLTEQELKALNSIDMEKFPNSIGVRNVNERIKLYFGTEYGVRYEKNEPKGVKAILHFPATL